MASNSAAASTACTTDDETTSSMDTDQDDHKEDNEEEHHHSKYGYDVETLSDREREELLMHLKHKLEHEETGVRDQDRIRDPFLELCLYSRHYDVDRAIQLLRNFMNFMEKHVRGPSDREKTPNERYSQGPVMICYHHAGMDGPVTTFTFGKNTASRPSSTFPRRSDR